MRGEQGLSRSGSGDLTSRMRQAHSHEHVFVPQEAIELGGKALLDVRSQQDAQR